MKYPIFIVVLFVNFYDSVYCDVPPNSLTNNDAPPTSDEFNETLSERTVKLKKQALRLMKQQGMNVDTEVSYNSLPVR